MLLVSLHLSVTVSLSLSVSLTQIHTLSLSPNCIPAPGRANGHRACDGVLVRRRRVAHASKDGVACASGPCLFTSLHTGHHSQRWGPQQLKARCRLRREDPHPCTQPSVPKRHWRQQQGHDGPPQHGRECGKAHKTTAHCALRLLLSRWLVCDGIPRRFAVVEAVKGIFDPEAACVGEDRGPSSSSGDTREKTTACGWMGCARRRRAHRADRPHRLGPSRARSLIAAAHSRGGMETARNLFKMIGEEGMHSRKIAS